MANEYVIPKNGKIVFNIERKDKVIGKHTFLFDKKNGIVTVNIDVNIQIKLGFLTIYKYIHKNKETWKGSELYNISTNSTTNSRKKYFVEGKQNNNKFEFTGIEGKKTIDKNIIPISYWNVSLIKRKEFLDSQKGIIRKLKVKYLKNSSLNFNDKKISTDKYQLQILTKHPSDEKPFPIVYVWYTKAGELMRLEFDSPEDKSIIKYNRIE